jgi:hypothetical protein
MDNRQTSSLALATSGTPQLKKIEVALSAI